MILKFWIILFSIGLISNSCNAQDSELPVQNIFTWDFYEYLSKSGLHEDALTWLFGFPKNMRSITVNNKINFEISKHYFTIGQATLSNTFLKKITCFNDTVSLNFAICIAFLVSDTGLIEFYTHRYKYLIEMENFKTMELSLKMLKGEVLDILDISACKENNALTGIAINYRIHKKKSPALAGFLSALVPGLGKLYLGYKYQAISSLTMNIVIDAIVVEFFIKSQSLLPLLIPLPVAAVFYFGNILGSVIIAKKREIDFQNNTHENIKTYYRNKLLCGK